MALKAFPFAIPEPTDTQLDQIYEDTDTALARFGEFWDAETSDELQGPAAWAYLTTRASVRDILLLAHKTIIDDAIDAHNSEPAEATVH